MARRIPNQIPSAHQILYFLSEITRKVSRQGLESLNELEKQSIPPLSEIRTDSPEYRQLVKEIYEQHAHAGQGNSQNF